MCLYNDSDPCAKKKNVDIYVEKDYYDARFRYRDAYPHEENALDDKQDGHHADAKVKEARLADAQERKIARDTATAVRKAATEKAAADRAANAVIRQAAAAANVAQKAADKAKKEADKAARAGGVVISLAVLPIRGVVLPAPVIPPSFLPIPAVFQPLGVFPALPPVLAVVPPLVLPPVIADVDAPVHAPVEAIVVRSRSGRLVRPNNRSGFTNCDCGCLREYDTTLIVPCHGGSRIVNNTGCMKRLNRTCCPDYVCFDCLHQE